MGLAWTLARKSLCGRPARSLLSALGIALGIAIGVAVMTLDYNTIHGLSVRDLAATPDVQVRPARGKKDAALELRATAGVAAAAEYFQNDAMLRPVEAAAGTERANPVRVRLFGLAAEAAGDLGAYTLLAGYGLSSARAEREVLLGEALAARLELGIGDKLWIARPKRAAKTACVEGKLVEVGPERKDPLREEVFEVVGILANEGLGRRSRGSVAIVDYEWGKELFAGVHLDTSYWVKRDPTVDLERLRTSLASSFSYELNRAVLRGQAADERAFRTGARMAGLLAMLLGLYVIFHTLSLSLIERLQEVGSLHALGLCRPQLARLFLIEALALAGCGSLCGSAAGIGLGFALQRSGITTLGAGKYVHTFVVPWWSVGSLTAIGFGLAMIGAIYPMLLLRGASLRAALRGEEALAESGVRRAFHWFAVLLLVVVLPGLYFVLVPVVGEFRGELVVLVLAALSVLATIVTLSFLMPALLARVCASISEPLARCWPLAGRLSARAMRQSPTRIATSAVAIALVGAAFVGLHGLTASLRGEVERWSEEAVLDKVFVEGLPDVSFQVLAEHLHRFPGVVAVERGSTRTHALHLLLGLDASELAHYGPLADSADLQAEFAAGQGILLSQRLALEEAYQVGDPYYVTRADGGVAEFRVLAISDAHGFFPNPDERIYGVVAASALQRHYCIEAETVSDVALRLAPGSDPEMAVLAVRDLLPEAEGLHFEYGSTIRAFHLADIERDFVLFDVLLGLTAILAGIGLLNGQLLAALERSKELGVLKALGASTRQLAGTSLLEAGIVGVVGGALAAVLGSLLTPLAIDALENVAGLELPPVAWPWACLAILGGASVALLAALYPILRLRHLDALRAVRSGG